MSKQERLLDLMAKKEHAGTAALILLFGTLSFVLIVAEPAEDAEHFMRVLLLTKAAALAFAGVVYLLAKNLLEKGGAE